MFFTQRLLSTLFLFWILLFTSTCATANTSSTQVVISNQVHQLLKVNSEHLKYADVEPLLEKIANNRTQYSNEVIAKVFLLAARVSSNQGDINKVFSFSKKGLEVNNLDKAIKLSLSLRLAEAYVAMKKYSKLLKLTEFLVIESKLVSNTKYSLLALSYRSVAFSILGQHQKALQDLQSVEQRMNQTDLSDRTQLLTIFALAYHHLGDYQTSLTMLLKIQKLRFELDQVENIAQTYLYSGYAYFYLQRYDDAYNAFWESKKSAKLKSAPINVAHANKGLGLILLRQGKADDALAHLQGALTTFSSHNMLNDRIETSVALAKAKLATQQVESAYHTLNEVIILLDDKDISPEFSGFNRMVADMYFSQKEYKSAYAWRIKDSDLLLQKLDSNKKSFKLLSKSYRDTASNTLHPVAVEQSKNIAVKLAETSQLSSSFDGKYKKQRTIITILAVIIIILFLSLLTILLRVRVNRTNLAYAEFEKPSYMMGGPAETKHHYQIAFKKARQYQYPLCVAYLIIDNWQELNFRFHRKVINEITKDIASVINLQIGEFDYAGLLSDGEYILLLEHQNRDEVFENITKLVSAVNSRSFANLGDVSVIMNFSINSPDFKDIDPYLFLARIAESVSSSQVNHSKVS